MTSLSDEEWEALARERARIMKAFDSLPKKLRDIVNYYGVKDEHLLDMARDCTLFGADYVLQRIVFEEKPRAPRTDQRNSFG